MIVVSGTPRSSSERPMTMLKALLGALGFEHVKVVFEAPPKK
jgi:hypothetical protein